MTKRDLVEKDWDETLFETLEYRKKIASDYRFLRQLSDWILELSGNVNVVMRLQNLAFHLKRKNK